MIKKYDLDRLLPPGRTSGPMIRSFWGSLFLALAHLIGAVILYSDAVRTIYLNISTGYYASGNDMTPVLRTVDGYLDRTMFMFLLAALIQLSFCITNYLYFHRESKSIYLMRRVHDPKELHKLCWRVPLIGAAVMLVIAGIIYGLFSIGYFFFAPAGHIPEQTIAFFWRYVP